jgi:hypothetical protein
MDKYNQFSAESFSMDDYRALMSSSYMGTFAENPRFNFDSAEDAGIFFAQELNAIKSKTYDVMSPELTAFSLFPFSSEVDVGAQEITYHSYGCSGVAKIIHDYATDLPRVDIKGTATTAKIKSVGDSYGYSIEEMRASRMAGKSLDVRKARAARRAIDTLLNKIAWAGDNNSGLNGVLSVNNNIPIWNAPQNGGGTSTKWIDKTPMEILADVSAMLSQVATTTKSVEKPNTLALPTEAYIHVSTTPRSENSDTTILKWILDNSPQIKKIVEAPELNSDSGISPYTGQNVGFLYSKNADKFTIENPLPFQQYPVQPKGLTFEIPCEARTAGAVLYYPLSALIAVGI